MPPRDPQVPPTPSTAVPAWYTKLRSRAVRPNPTDSILRNQVGYTGPRERTQRQDGRASQETSHRRAARTWDRPQSYYTRSWAVKYLDQCLCPTAADPGAQHVASAMQYLAQPWFLHQRAVLGASLMVSYRDMLEDLVRQSRHWHTLLRRARVWTTSADQHYQRHDRRVQLFSVMSQLWASERAAHWVEPPLPKRHCRTRPGILANARHQTWPLQSDESLSLLKTCGEWHTRDAACLTPLNLTHYRLAIWRGGFAYRNREPSVIRM